ncbi:MAG: hypothetical protein HY687_02760 [Chloroflexi bacterium]|nr:hypothetical protein [Chloroflexota bacterium]
MPAVAIKLFRDPDIAKKVMQDLGARGYKAQEIASVGRGSHEKGAVHVKVPEMGDIVATGVAAAAIKEAGAKPSKEALLAALAKAWGVSPDSITYYELGLSMGGTVVSVHTEEPRLAQAQEVLRQGDQAAVQRTVPWSNSPGFKQAKRMLKTDPRDAEMSGDWRKY